MYETVQSKREPPIFKINTDSVQYPSQKKSSMEAFPGFKMKIAQACNTLKLEGYK